MKAKISFIIPTINEYQKIKPTIDSIYNQCSNLNYEVVIVVNNTNVNLANFKNKDLNVFYEKNRGRSYARNRGVSESTGDWVAFIDDDVLLDENWLKSFEPYLKDPFFDVLQGQVYPSGTSKNGFFDKYRKEVFQNRFDGSYSSLDKKVFSAPFCNTASCMFKKSSLDVVNGFDTRFDCLEDVDLSWSLWFSNMKFVVVSGATSHVQWNYKYPLISYLIREIHMGFGSRNLFKKYISDNPKKVNIKWNRYEFSKFSFRIYDYLIQVFFTIGFIKHLFFSNISFEKNKIENKNIILLENDQYQLFLGKFLRVLKTSKELILVDIRNNAKVKHTFSSELYSSLDLLNFLLEKYSNDEIKAFGTLISK